MESTVKKLTRVQLINWHYFENERICLEGSTLISGENTAGKSTILDAIQLVLTTNSRRFNAAANEKGSRTLRSYVRCKVGMIGETYLRKGTVPANVALEFYEEKTDRYFVLGVHLLSPDEEGPVVKKWYAEECRLEDLSFITDGRPSLAEEFKNRAARIRYIETDKAARDRFRHRMGNLDEKFFDIIPKSLAFKPMDNVKEFINKFVLNEGKVDVQALRSNIEVLDDLEKTMEKTRNQLASLETILSKFEEIDEKDKNIRINEFLLKTAARDACLESIGELRRQIVSKKQAFTDAQTRVKTLTKDIAGLNERILSLRVDINNNESGKLVESLKRNAAAIEERLANLYQEKRKLTEEVGRLKTYLLACNEIGIRPEWQRETGALLTEDPAKADILNNLEGHFSKDYPELSKACARQEVELDGLDEEVRMLREKQKALEKRQLPFPPLTLELKKLIETEFSRRGISSPVYIFSDLLEISDERWRNAVEGYLNTQKFYLVVEPEHYPVALDVYDRNRGRIHTAGILNTRKIPINTEISHDSLAYVVKSENRYAYRYIAYVLGRVTRCEKVEDLENFPIAITPECMLYQGYVVRHINPKEYQDPYIGANAYRVQLENVRKSIEETILKRKPLRELHAKYTEAVRSGARVNLPMIRQFMHSPSQITESENELTRVKAELKTAENDPTLIELTMKLEETTNALAGKEAEKEEKTREQSRLEITLEQDETALSIKEEELAEKETALGNAADFGGSEYEQALEKYQANRKTKSPQKIFENFTPQKTQFEHERDELVRGLYSLQADFNRDFSLDFLTGEAEKDRYIQAADKLRKVEIVRYEEKLRTAKEDCEKIFRSDFLSKMKEHIENAKMEFRNLNKALENVYYGDDSYHFNITFDRKKENLYRMITSEYNMEGEFNLWTGLFEAEYKDEIEDLFAKLMVGDDNGEKVIEEYTDYRSYLDYDIEIRKKNGQKQRFSDIYGEKSGSETQVPYYVAIAASFYQIYRFGNSVRLMLLDEAFDKLDDDRIQSMMDFMNSLNLQVILATPPSKIEVIGEHVNTILTAIRVGTGSIVEEYDL